MLIVNVYQKYLNNLKWHLKGVLSSSSFHQYQIVVMMFEECSIILWA